MPLYLGHPNNGNQTISEALLARGINLLRAKPSEVAIIAYAEITQPAFSSYFSNLPAFMEASYTGHVQPLRREGFPIAFPIESCFPLQLANLIVDFPRSLTQEQTEQLGRIGYQQVALQNKTALVFQSPTLSDIRLIRSFGANPITRASINTVNLDAIGSIVLVQRIFSSFFFTHCYPAFSDDDQTVPYQDFDAVFEWSDPRKRKATAVESGIESYELPSAPIDQITLYRAKPSVTDSPRWGTSGQLPNAAGILIPYVTHLAVYDRSMVPDVVYRYFFKCLGPTFTQCKVNYDKLKTAWGLIHQTESGNVLAHMAKMIDIVGHCQARVFPIFDNNAYSGSVISGSRFVLSTVDSLYRPLSYASLQDELIRAKFHSAVLSAISAIVGDVDQAIPATTSMRELSNMLRTLDISEEKKDSVRKEAVHLNYGVKYLAINSTTIQQIIHLLKDTSTAIPSDLPLHPNQLFESDRVASVLSAFGYNAPTFLIPSCPTIQLLRSAEPPKTFVCRTVALSSAIADWKLMIRSKYVTNNPSNLSKSFKDRSYTGMDKKVIWNALIDLVTAQGVSVDKEVGVSNEVVGLLGGTEFDPFAI